MGMMMAVGDPGMMPMIAHLWMAVKMTEGSEG
jgi:hypothetical protein